MKKKKIETLGQLLQYLVDDEEGKQIRNGENGIDDYGTWVCKELDKRFMDEDTPQLTFEMSGSESVLKSIFIPLKETSHYLDNGCSRCLHRMEKAYEAKIKNNQK